ncbi:hypothetical protein [Pseudomonas aeruginosa]|uniref:hypothetical protein n=1 Tax=Pseudomonas aeruginosa TaxID=287 RepID=UPI0025A85C0E|nr:hypothetical protein [Pseudomonas aeruginosa]HBP6285832.1 hypothetical protein [Pseudomonas aeruginosa]HCF1981516.1 hypothetical protein [Pseudomonas aeruginosa]HCF6192537.1 hypothetical protein [Pseudomonas aeruginosa]
MMNTHNGITQEALEFALPLLERLGEKDGGTATEAVEKVRAAIEQIKAAADPISTQAWMLDARKQIAGIAESRTLTTVQYSFGHALGWIAGMRRAGGIDWPMHDALYHEATEAMKQWRRPEEEER